jgi:pantoate--beta-alanine ligase|tara:strand:- start:96923 stop:97768 length:846 start_codon:yes stop_codon:yes gene_type:complete
MQVVRTVAALRVVVDGWRRAGEKSALIPTMGALHAGHLALVATGRAAADRTVASIFVNPTQFAAGEDLDRYPRQEVADRAALEEVGCDLLYAPAVEEMYPDGFATSVRVAGLPQLLCGNSRPGHFDGVATVVAKLFSQARTDMAVFGEKDWQQLAIIRRAARDLDLPVEILGVPIVRDEDGLALSSRNAYLSPGERAKAVALPDAMKDAVTRIEGGDSVPEVLQAVREALTAAGFAVDYVELRGAEDLEALSRVDRPARLFAAASIGKTRLIDNMAVVPGA